MAYLLDRYGAFSQPVIIKYTQQVLRGLAYLHDIHILHRDLKGMGMIRQEMFEGKTDTNQKIRAQHIIHDAKERHLVRY